MEQRGAEEAKPWAGASVRGSRSELMGSPGIQRGLQRTRTARCCLSSSRAPLGGC